MNRPTMVLKRAWLSLLLPLLLLAATGQAVENNLRATTNLTPLDEYVAAPDANYAYELTGTFKTKEFTSHIIRMTSQQWRTPQEVDQPVWKHWLTIVVPKKVKHDTALMIISGGGNNMDAPKGADPNLRRAALATGAICAQINNIPNEPLVFTEDGKRRSEDSIIAFNWKKFLLTGDATWLTRLPMTKAVVRAMDTVQDFCAKKEGGKHKVKDFVVGGASKRGWTTWTTAAVDKRVVAAAPIVIDLLNIVPSFEHHWEVYGSWAEAVGDYVEQGVMDWMGSAEFNELARIVEPYSYRDRLTMPKLIMNGSGDQFFVNDSWKFYLKDLQGPTWIRYAPNAGHGQENAKAAENLIAFFHHIVTNTPLPEYKWTFTDANTVRVTANTKPLSVKLWQATNPDARDFRVDTFGHKWTATDLQPEADGSWIGKVTPPEKGWTAYLVEINFKGLGEDNFMVTTPTQITPDTKPYTFTAKPEVWEQGYLHKQTAKN